MRNRILWCSKKIELAFEICTPVHETQFAKTTKKMPFFTYLNVNVSRYLMETGKDRTGAFYKIIIWIQAITVTPFQFPRICWIYLSHSFALPISLLGGGGEGGVGMRLQSNFKKGRFVRISIFRRGLLGKRDFFQVGLQFLHKKIN